MGRTLEAVNRIKNDVVYTIQDWWKYFFIGLAFGLGFHLAEWFMILFVESTGHVWG